MESNLLKGAPLYYPSAKDWMWNYCIYLGPFTDNCGNNYDLGVYIDDTVDDDYVFKYSNASVFADQPGSYLSGSLRHIYTRTTISDEVIRRINALGIAKIEHSEELAPKVISGMMTNFIEDHINDIENE